MFMGQFSHTVDAKGRIIIPAKLREELGEDGVMTCIDATACLAIYTAEQFQKIAQQLEEKGREQGAGAMVQNANRVFFGNACTIEFDKQGRVLIPPNLRKMADLKKNVTILGVNTKIELWSTERLEAKNIENAAMDMEQLGVSF